MDFDVLIDLYENNDPQLENEIFSQIVSDDHQELNQVLTQTTKFQSVCGDSIDQNQLSFSCFTCSSDPNHLICAQCFDVRRHKNHKFLLNDVYGCCDCGDTQIIPQIICDNHQGYEKVNKIDGLEKIQRKVKDNISDFIINCNKKLQEIYTQIRPNCEIQNPLLVEIYFMAKNQKISQVLEIFGEYEMFYEKLKKGAGLHNIFIKFMIWLIKQHSNYTFLITQILQQKNIVSNQTIFEDLIERQVIFESFGKENGESLNSLCFHFYADKEFKSIMHQTYFKKFSYLFLQQKTNKSSIQCLKTIIEILKCQDQQQNQQSILEYAGGLKQILEQVIKNSQVKDIALIHYTSLWQMHPQYCSIENLEVFFFQLHQYALQSFRVFEEILYSNIYIDNLFLFIKILSFRYDQPWFKGVLNSHLQQLLKQIQPQFNMNILNQGQMKYLLNSGYFLIKFIDILSSANVSLQVFEKESLYVLNLDVQNITFILNHQSLLLKMITKSISNLREKLQNPFAKRNLSRLLLTQCFKIVESKIQQNQVETDQIDKFKKQFIKETDSDEQLIEKFKKLYLCILKRPIICEQLIVELLYLEYFDGAYQNPMDFLINLKQLFEIDDFKLVNQVLDHILSICIQNVVSNRFYMDTRVLQVYQSSISKRPCLESVDLAFIRIYTYLYGNEGKQKFIDEIKRKQIPIQKSESEIQDYIVRTLMTSNLELWNLLQFLEPNFDIYPIEVKEALSEAIINIFTLGSNHSFKDIDQYCKMVGISTYFHFDIQIKKVCQLEQQTKKFVLKNKEDQFYDPFLFRRSQVAQGKIYERLIDQPKEESFILFGNQTTYFLKHYQEIISKHNPLFTDFMMYYIDKNQIKTALNKLQQGEDLSLISYQLYHNQIVIGLKLHQNELYYGKVKSVLSERAKQNYNEKKLCEQLIQNANTLFQDQKQQKNLQLKTPTKKKNFLIQKFKQKQYELVKKWQGEQINVESVEEVNKCDFCKLHLTRIEAVTPVLISIVPNQELYQIIPYELQILVKNQNLNLTQWKLVTCKHFFHFTCLQDIQNSQRKQEILKCPICKQFRNAILPLNSTTIQQDQFFQGLVKLLYELNVDQFTKGDFKNIEDVVLMTLFSLFFGIILELLIDKDQFIRSGKQEILKHFIEIIRIYCFNQQIIKEFLQFPKDIHFVLDLLMTSQAYIYSKVNKDEYLENTQNVLRKISTEKNQETIKVLFCSFGLPLDQISIQNNPQIDRIFISFQSLQETIIKNIQCILGDNFETFRFTHLHKCCKKCGFYNQQQLKSKGIALCLLCLNLFCVKTCSNTQFGNLNTHSKEFHQETSIFIDMDTTKVYLITFPMTIVYDNALYFDDMGQNAEKNNYQQWNNYKLENEKVQKLAKILLFNQFQPIVMNSLDQEIEFDIQGQY